MGLEYLVVLSMCCCSTISASKINFPGNGGITTRRCDRDFPLTRTIPDFAMQNTIPNEADLLKATDGDVYLLAYPKAGVTWTTEVLTAIYSQYAIENPSRAAEFEGAIRAHGFCTSCPLSRRHSTKPGQTSVGYDINGNAVFHDETNDQKPRRLISLHFPVERMEALIPDAFQNDRVKMIYVARNAKDVAVSYYHFHKMNETLPTPESWEEFLDDFISGSVRCGSWFEHVRGWWRKHIELQQQHTNKLLLVTFESLKRNTYNEVERICSHLGLKLSPEGIEEVCFKCNFTTMKRDPRRNHSQNDIFKGDFLRKGKVGDWQNQFTQTQRQEFDDTMHSQLGNDYTPIVNSFAM